MVSSEVAGEASKKKRSTPPATPTKKSPEKKHMRVTGDGEGMTGEAQTTEPPKEVPKLPNKTSEQSMLELALEKIAMLEQQIQTQKESVEKPAGSKEKPDHPAKGPAMPGVTSHGVGTEAEAPLFEGSEKPEDGDPDDIIVMPTGSEAT